MESWNILYDILILLAAAFLLGTVAELLKQNAIVGYLLAGMAVGPFGFGLVRSRENMELIAEMGVALLLFSIGLEFSFKRLRSLGPAAIWGGILQISATAATGAGLAKIFGLDLRLAVFIGAMVCLSSTASVLRLLAGRAALDSVYGRNSLGILLVQDIAVLPLTLVLAVVAGGENLAVPTGEVLLKILAISGGVIGFYVVFAQIIPRLFEKRPWGTNRELPVILAIVMAVGAAVAAHEAGISPALGAFAAGLLIAGTPFATQVRADVGILRATMVTLFFVSIGMMGDPSFVVKFWPQVFGSAFVVVVGKTLIIWTIMRLLGVSPGMSLATGVCLAQIGEFSFVLAALGRGTIIGDHVFRIFVAVTVVSLIATPYLVSSAPTLAGWFERWFARRKKTQLDEPLKHVDDLILIIGFGPAGEQVAEALHEKMRERMVVIDTNPANAVKATRYGLHMHVGDATHADVLEHAGIYHASTIVITLPDTTVAKNVIRICKDMNMNAKIIARARYHMHAGELISAGATKIFDEEKEIGIEMAKEIY